MNCWHCGGKVIWGGDFDYEDYGIDREGIVSNLSCSKCKAYYECYLDLEENKDEEGRFKVCKESKESKESS